MKVTNLKRLIKEDFDKDNQDLIEKLAFVINPLVEQIVSAFNNNIDFDNLNQQYKSITVTVDTNGIPSVTTEIKYTLSSQLKGIICVSAQNNTDTTAVTGAPFISYSISGSVIKVLSVSGLPPNKRFTLNLILIG